MLDAAPALPSDAPALPCDAPAPASDAALASDAPALPAKPPRSRSIDARRTARAAKARREQRIMAFLVKGVSVAELAGREGLSERRMRAIVQDILSRRMPEPPAEFLALQVARLNEAMIVAHGAMGNGNLKAVECVMKITRELDRYHGFAEAIEARADRRPWTSRPAPAADRQARPAPRRLEMAPQAIESLQFTPGNSARPEEPTAEASAAGLTGPSAPATDPLPWAEAAIDPAAMAEASSAPPVLEAPPVSARLETAPQAIENRQFTLGNSAPPEAAASPEEKAAEAAAETATDPEPAPAPALETPAASGRLQMAPQTIENLQFKPGSEAPPEAAGSAQKPATEIAPAEAADPAATSQAAPEAETDAQSMDDAAPAGRLDPDPAETVPAVPPPGMVVANVILPPRATPQPGPTAFTGYIRCAGVTTYYSR
jgi:hypothetical protein